MFSVQKLCNQFCTSLKVRLEVEILAVSEIRDPTLMHAHINDRDPEKNTNILELNRVV
jgi:hypothetical protein